MDRPTARHSPASTPRLFAESELGETKAKILDATFRRLAREGYAALSVREIAKDAGVNHALINYHFHGKDQLVLAVLEEANQRLLQRQQQMYGEPTGFAEKWRSARRFYQEDLASGFVRVQAELWAASFSNPELRAKFLPQILAWKELVLGGVREALAQLDAQGAGLPSPFSAEVLATWISEFWLGMEFADLLGVTEPQLQHGAALDAVEQLLEALDARAGAASSAPQQPRKSSPIKKSAAPEQSGRRKK